MKEKSCGAVIIKKEEDSIKALLVKQVGGSWSFPKGHVEEGETEQETAIREVKEETGLDIRLKDDFRKVITYSPYEGVIKDVVLFLAKPITQKVEIDPYEILEYKWMNIYEMKDMFLQKENQKVVADVIDYFNKN